MSSRITPVRGASRTTLVGVLIAAIVALTFTGIPTAAQAATVGTFADLQAALSPGTDSTVTLSGEISAPSSTLIIDRDVTLDLAGNNLYVTALTVTAGNTVTLIAGSGVHAGAMTVLGTLVLGADMTMVNGSTVTVGAAGKIVNDGTPRTLSGMYNLANGGIITATVGTIGNSNGATGNAFTLRFVDNLPSDARKDITVYAPTFAAAELAFPTFSRTHATIASWTSEKDGSGTTLTTTTALSPANWLFYAQWVPSGITSIAVSYGGSPGSAHAGSIDLVATDTSAGGGNAVITDLVDFESSDPADEVDRFGSDAVLAANIAGSRTVTGTLKGFPAVTSTVTVPVTHSGFVDDMTLAMNPTSLVSGNTSAAVISATDQYGNSLGANLFDVDDCDYCPIEMTSSDPTDVIDPVTGRITFTTPGLHTITATVRMVESDPLVATATVNVIAAPAVTPPKTLVAAGFDSTPAPWVALLVLLLGIGTVLTARRRRA